MLERCGGCAAHVYEPVERHSEVARRRLSAFPGAVVHRAAVGAARAQGKVLVQGLSSRLDAEGGEPTEVVVRGTPPLSAAAAVGLTY
mmetsp:Transcript_36424/g.88081  ORF Transcript_36424/g.88081 Transcript_36424/m.88081 type:complete len:87 (+) Transcript_36424:3-263(+)